MPLDVAVEEPQRRVRRLEPDHQVRPGPHRREVARDDRLERRRGRVVRAVVGLPLRHDPEALPVEVQRVDARVGVVDDEVDDVAVLEVEDVVSGSARRGVGREGSGREGGVEQRRGRGARVGDVVEEEVLRAVCGELARRDRDGDRPGRGLCFFFVLLDGGGRGGGGGGGFCFSLSLVRKK